MIIKKQNGFILFAHLSQSKTEAIDKTYTSTKKYCI